MTTFYSIVQYVPDPIRDERANVGVVVFGDGQVRTRFLHNWTRVRQFGSEDISFLQQFANRAKSWSDPEVPLPGLGEAVRLDESGLRAIAGRWLNTIQFTEPRASTLEPEALLNEMANRMLTEAPTRRTAYRDRRIAGKIARDSVREALKSRVGNDWRQLMKRRETRIPGQLDEHSLDVVVGNGNLRFAAQGLSFENDDDKEVDRDVKITAWTVDDIRNAKAGLELAVVALPPRHASMVYDHALHIFQELHAEVVPETAVKEWAERVASAVVRDA
jgi:hypothetical protein